MDSDHRPHNLSNKIRHEPFFGWFSHIVVGMREERLSKKLTRLRAKTSWTWTRMAREFHRVMGYEGPSHTTLFRYAAGKVKRPNVLAERYVQEAIQELTVEFSRKEDSPK